MNDSNQVPLVSICCVTYKHESYLRQCLDGFLMQKTNFAFEILVHDDASTDSTAEIVKEYESHYPNLFRNVYQTENQFKKQNVLINILFKMAKGKYIALCEGDDYWTDPYKLQKQVNFLEVNSQYAITYHDSIKVDSIDNFISDTEVGYENRCDFSRDELQKGVWLSTRSMCFRNSIIIPELMNFVSNGDIFLTALIGEIGDGKYLSEISPSAYRIHDRGLWSSSRSIDQLKMLSNTFKQLYIYFKLKSRVEISIYYKDQYLKYLKRAYHKSSKLGLFYELHKLLILNIKINTISVKLYTEFIQIYIFGILKMYIFLFI